MSKSFSYSIKYSYDKLNRVTSAVYSNGTCIRYTYDPAGNMVSAAKGAFEQIDLLQMQEKKNACTNCKSEIMHGTKFCVECGTSVPASMEAKSDKQAAYCTSCGQEAPSGSKFCTNCGSPVK